MSHKSKTRPNFFIVGAPRCGTTALHTYLSDHDQVVMSSPKEPNYFATNFPTQRYVTDDPSYLSLFRDVDENSKAIGEASAWYLYSREAIDNIREFNANAKIIVMVRNPISLLPSIHKMLQINFAEDQEDLETAWKLQADRQNGRNLPKGRNQKFDVSTLQYREVCRLGEQVQHLFTQFPPSQIKAILFDDFITDTKNVYCQTLDFLGIAQDGRSEFPQVNSARNYKSKWLGWSIWKLRDIGSAVKSKLGITRSFAIQQKLNSLNKKPVPRQTLSKEFIEHLQLEFREDILLLQEVLGVSLADWLAKPASADQI